MKITIYELLGMVKDGKAPKKIKWGDTKYTLYIDEDTKQKYYQDDKCRYFFLDIKYLNDLTDEVEILDDEEKGLPEKIRHDACWIYDDETNQLEKITLKDDLILNKLDEIIDYLEKQRKGE